MTSPLTLLAQVTQPAVPDQPPASPVSGLELFFKQLFPLFLIIAIFWWWMSRSRSKERQRYEAMLSALKRNDRVQTVGGIIGTVVEVRGSEVILKVDETNNVKMRFNRSAIKEVLAESAEGA